MTIDEAIEHAREVAHTCNDHQCAVDHMQIAEWLSLLKVYTDTGMAKEVQRARHEMHGWQLEWKREMERRKELEAENTKMRNLLQQNYEFIVHLNETEAHPGSEDLDMQRWLLLNEAGIEVDS